MTPPPELLAAWGVTLIELAAHDRDTVWYAERGGAHVVVKQGDPLARVREAAALGAFTQRAVRLLAQDGESGTLLIERVLLGDDIRPLATVDDDAATAVVGELAVALHARQGEVEGLPELGAIGVALELADDPRLPRALIARALSLLRELTSDPAGTVLHGDLQHANVLRRGYGGLDDAWVAIDPHGWRGDPVFDVAALLVNPQGLTLRAGQDVVALTERRIAVLADATGFDPHRMRAWAFTAAVIAECWMVAGHDLVHGAPLALARELAHRV